MYDQLRPYYERELTLLRKLSAEFAAQYPKIAGRLLLEADVCEDPHAERLLEAFALLAARIHRKLDDEFPEITDAFLGVLYPHYLRPVPSMSIVQFQIDPRETQFTTRQAIHRHTPLFSQPVKGMPCQFRTCYPVELWPVDVVAASFDILERSPFAGHASSAVAVLNLRLHCRGDLKFAGLKAFQRLRFFLDGEGTTTYSLYELLFNNTRQIVLKDSASARECTLEPDDCLERVGFARDEGMLDYDNRSFLGYRLLHEYFAFPEKFLFFDLEGLEQVVEMGFGQEIEIAMLLNEFELAEERIPYLARAVNAHTFRLGVTPIVNLFRRIADQPKQLTHTKTEYKVVPDPRWPMGMEVYSVDRVRKRSKPHGQEDTLEFRRFYSFKHGVEDTRQRAFWHASRRPALQREDTGTDVFLSFVDLAFNPATTDGGTLIVETTCTNRDLPNKLPFGGGEQGDFSLEGNPLIQRIRCLRKPTPTLRPPLKRGAQWRLISHLCLNHLSIVEGGRAALVEILRLYNFANTQAITKQIQGIIEVRSEPDTALISLPQRAAFCRGTRIILEFDEDQYAGAGVYLFASVLDHFLGLYTTLNSFIRLTVTTRQREKELATWPPRAGDRPLV